MKTSLSNIIEYFEEPVWLKTGCRALDYYKLVRGGTYGIITAEQKIGKTTFIDGHIVARAIEEKIPVLYFSLEGRGVTRIINVISNKLRKRIASKADVENNKELIESCLDSINKYLSVVAKATTLEQFEATVKEWLNWRSKEVIRPDSSMQGHKLGIIILDNMANISNSIDNDVRRLIEYTSKTLAKIANNDNTCVIGIQHQSVFAKEQVEASVNTLGDCRTTSRDVDWLLGISAPHKYTSVYEGIDISRFLGLFRVFRLLESRLSPKGLKDFSIFAPEFSEFVSIKDSNRQLIKNILRAEYEALDGEMDDDTKIIELAREII